MTLDVQSSSVELCRSGDSSASLCLGSVLVSNCTTWSDLEETIAVIFLNHISEVSLGLQTKKTCRSDQDVSDAPNPLSLGISLSSIKYYSIGDLSAVFYSFVFIMFIFQELIGGVSY